MPKIRATETKVTSEEATRNAAFLVAYGEVGRASLSRLPCDQLQYGSSDMRLRKELGRVRKLAAKHGLTLRFGNLDSLIKLRRAAAEYTKDQLGALAASVKDNRSRFSTSHLIRLLAVADRKKRDKLGLLAVEKSWTLSDLDRRVQVARRARRGAGRLPKVPAGRSQRLVALEGLCVKWLRWTTAASDRLPPELMTFVSDACRTVGMVRTKTTELLGRPVGCE